MKIVRTSKKGAPAPPQITELVTKLLNTRDEDLTQVLQSIDEWIWPRSDLHSWVKVLNKFDAVLEEIISDYEVDQLQVRPFSPTTKNLVIAVLRFQRLLLENSTNRKIYSSYDRLNSLLWCSDLDIIIFALNVLLRPAQQYSAQASVSHALSISLPRLQSLCKRWPHIREHTVGLIDYCQQNCSPEVDALPSEAREVNYSFYKTKKDGSSGDGGGEDADKEEKMDTDATADPFSTENTSPEAATTSSGATQVHITEHEITTKSVIDLLADITEKYSPPDDERFELLCRIRAAKALTKEGQADRSKLVTIRLLAIAIFGHTQQEPQALPSLFLYEPDLISHIAELLQIDRGVPVRVQTAAIASLDSLSRYRVKSQEVLSAINAGVNHGILMALFRKTVNDIADPNSNLPQSFTDALLSWITYISSHSSGGNMIVGAGLIPLLIQLVENKVASRMPVLSKAMALVDNIMYGFPNAFTMFCNAQGVNAVVGRIEYEIDRGIDDYKNVPTSNVISSQGELTTIRNSGIKHVLRSMHRIMQSSGTSEGLRGLIDTSLLKSVQKIIEHRLIFGPSILPLAINILSTFVHNEPTSLGVIQEAKVPETFFKAVEDGVEASIEVIQAVSNALGALCLNEAGQAQVARRPSLIPGIFNVFTSEAHLKILIEKENSVMVGTSIDELVRHHPGLKTVVFESIKSTLTKIEDMGRAYRVPDDLRQWYLLSSTSSTATGTDITMEDAEPLAGSSKETNVAEHADNPVDPDSEEADEPLTHDNFVVTCMDIFGRFLEGLFQHTPHCRDFIHMADGLTLLGRLTSLPCLPYDFANSVASDSMVQVTRTIIENASDETLPHLTGLVRESLSDTRRFWDTVDDKSKLLPFVNLSAPDEEYANHYFRSLVTLHIRVTLLADVFSTAGYAQGRTAVGLLHTLLSGMTGDIIRDLGALHRVGIWENTILNAGLIAQGIEIKLTPSPSPSGRSPNPSNPHLLDVNGAGIDGGVSSSNTLQPGSAQNLLSSTSTSGHQNARALKHLSHGLPTALTPFFQAMVKMFHVRRSLDGAQRKQVAESSKILAGVMVKHLTLSVHADIPSMFSYYTMMLGLFTILLVDERTASHALHTVQLFALYRAGGLDSILTICCSFMDTIESVHKIRDDERTDLEKRELIHAYGGIKIALHLIRPMISSKALFESGQTMTLVTRDKPDTDPDYFEPHNFLVKLRTALLPIVQRLWGAEWLLSSPLNVIKSIVKVTLEMVGAEGEEVGDVTTNISSVVREIPPRVTVPDAENVRMLIEMGFPRHAAERALIRVNNNISAATELLLSTPFPLPPDPVQGDTPEAEPEAESEDHERTEDVPSTSAEPEAAEEVSNPEPEEVAPANPGKSSEQWKKDLDELREPLRTGLSRKALLLIDEHISLLFDLRVVFVRPNNTHHKQATQELVSDIKQFSPGAYDVQEQPLANRCRLLALVLSESPSMLDQETQTSLMETLLALLLSSADHPDHPPKWLASHLLVTEALFTVSVEPRSITLPKEGEPVEPQILTVGPDYAEARARVFDFCVRLLDTSNLPSDEFLSVLRLLVFLTRDHVVAKQFLERNGVSMLFHRVKEAAVPSSSSYIAIILRHLLEDEQTIRQIMQHTIKRYFSGPRTRTIDINNYLRSCSALALRSPHLFVDVTSSLCQLTHPYSPTPIITLKPEAPVTATELNPSSPTADMQIDPPQVSQQTSAAMSVDAEAVVHLLTSELMAAVKAINESTPTLQVGAVNAISPGDEIVADNLGPSTTPDPPQSTAPSTFGSESASDSTDYACFLMQCLTELLFSYEPCKLAFLSYTSKRRNQTPAKEPTTKFRTGTLQFFLTDLITFGTIDPQPNENARTRINLCNWALSVIVALCVDNIPHHDTKEVSPDLVSVRKLVFEAISRAIKEPPFSNNIDARYGRLLAMADLCHRLLTVKVNNTSRKQTDESPTHIAKIMLEKNFVATLTNALSEIDLNYPNVRGLVPSILRPLEHLTKIAIRMSRASGRGKEMLEDSKSDSESSYASDMDTEEMEESGREETPDLYRNSALGMYTGEMDDNQYNDSEMDESDAEDDDDVEMDFADETGSENTSNSDEEDEGEADDDGELWDEGDEEEDDLIQNEEEIDDDDEREIGEDEDGDEEELWQDVEGQIDGVRLGGDGLDDEEESHLVPIQIVHQEEHAMNPMGSDDEDYDSGDNAQNGFTFSDGLVNTSNEGNTGEVFIQRRRDGGNPATGRARNNAPPPVEITTHPLLMDNSSAAQRVPAPSSQTARGHRQPQRIPADGRTEVIQTIEDLIGGGAFQLFNQIMSRGNGANAGFQSIRVDVPSGTVINVQRRGGQVTYTTSVRVEPRQEQQPRVERPGRSLEPSLTSQRWTQEVKILNGEFINDRLGKLANHVVLALLPLAIEALKQAKDLEAEQRKKEEEAKAAAEEEARKQQLDSEQNAETAPPPESIPAEGVSEPEDQMVTDAPDVPPAADTVMTDATGADQVASGSTDANDSAEADGSTSAARERITVMIHGSPVDITETGIDPTFLEALPDDMREEVLNQHVREQRAARVERPPDSQISAEFLDALPPEIRAEIIQQEAMQRAQQSRTGAPAEMDNASFFATLDPSLRQAVLSEQDEGIIQNLPSHILAEVGDTNWRQRQASHPPSTTQTAPQPPQPISKKAAPSHDAIQLLDRTGVAVLVRLLFFPQVSKKSLLLRVLGNLSENAKTRTELFNLLLGILQDGSGDLAAIDRSFSQMSVKGSKPHTLKTPIKPKQTIDSWTSAFTPQPLQSDAVPDLIAQRCLEALGYVVHANDSSSLFFLTEHELPASLRRHPPKKGKGKEKQLPQTYYPIVLLLGLLDRQSLLKTPAIVEAVVGLLAMVTRPLSSLKGDKSTEPTQAPSEPESGTVSISAPEAPAPTSTITDSTSDAQNTSVPLPTAPESPERLVNTVEATEEKALLATPPQIPQSALRLIVNILTVGECSGRTFQQSLALIQHLSFIPDVRDIIAQELRLKAQEASHQLSSDLDELALALERPQSDHLASVAARFSPASSIQARLLRVLKTIDYMYSPRLSTSEATGHEDIDKVQVIYESFQFSGLWRRLGSCLSLIAEDPTTDHIATVLLPLIESLMVVCKYAGSKGSIRSPTSPRSPTIPSPESMEDLFVTFTDAHRKLLNLMVRNNPSLMSGSFSLLVHNPRVLDFDNKRNYFNQQLHRRPPHTREQHGTLQVNVRRARVFEDSFQNLQRKTGDQIKYGKLSVRFYQEEGVDAGGVTREWFQILARQMFDPNYALFQPCAADKLTYQPNKNSWVNPEHLSFFKFVGRIIGKAIYDGRLLDAYFARSLYRQLLAKPVDYKDVEWVDPEYYNSLCWILENDPTLLDLTFSVEADEFGVQKVIPLKENGDSIPVTQENKREFVQLSAQYRLYSSIEKQIDSLLAGFYEIVPKDLVAIFNEQELELLISGTPDIDVDEWRAATEYNGYTSSDPNIVWWWRALKSFNRDERAKVLSFATGTSRVPLNGFTDLQGVQGVQRFSIHKAYGEPDRLPQAHTCFNQIDLPQYTSYEMLRQQLVMAINEGGEGFAFS